MATTPSRKLFVNLPIRDLKRSVDFFTKLGFTFNPQFTDETTTCMIVSEDAFFMLLEQKRFQTFTKKRIADAKTSSEALIAISCNSRGEVDELVQTALKNGATPAMPKQDHGFMTVQSFYDLDDHHWEVLWMDPAHVQK